MPVERPYYRCYRPFLESVKKSEEGEFAYIADSRNIDNPATYVRQIELLYKDIKEVFNYIEPADTNNPCYSVRLYELLVRCCTLFESSCKDILQINNYKKNVEKYNIKDYYLLSKTHHLYGYTVKVPYWKGSHTILNPFSDWISSSYCPLGWYQAYNHVKHDAIQKLNEATLLNVMNAFAGITILYASEFYNDDFAQAVKFSLIGDIERSDKFGDCIGSDLRLKRPTDWLDEEKYFFDWDALKGTPEPYQKLFV